MYKIKLIDGEWNDTKVIGSGGKWIIGRKISRISTQRNAQPLDLILRKYTEVNVDNVGESKKITNQRTHRVPSFSNETIGIQGSFKHFKRA